MKWLARKDLRHRAPRYMGFLVTFFLLFALWADLLGKYDLIPYILGMFLPLLVAAALALDISGFHPKARRGIDKAITLCIGMSLLPIGVIIFVVIEELWLLVPYSAFWAMTVGRGLLRVLSERGDRQAASPQA
jgi:hypothetical protein